MVRVKRLDSVMRVLQAVRDHARFHLVVVPIRHEGLEKRVVRPHDWDDEVANVTFRGREKGLSFLCKGH